MCSYSQPKTFILCEIMKRFDNSFDLILNISLNVRFLVTYRLNLQSFLNYIFKNYRILHSYVVFVSRKHQALRHILYVLIKAFRSLAWKVHSLKLMLHIWNEQRSVQFITFVIYLCLFLYCSKCEAVENKQMPVMYETWCPEFLLTCSRNKCIERSRTQSKHEYSSWHVPNHSYVCTHRRTSLQM